MMYMIYDIQYIAVIKCIDTEGILFFLLCGEGILQILNVEYHR